MTDLATTPAATTPNSNRARVIKKGAGQYTSRHENVTQEYEHLYDVWNPESPSDPRAALRETTSAIQAIIEDAIRAGAQLRAYGSKWSLSKAPVTNGRLINTAPMNLCMRMTANDVAPEYNGDLRELVLMQCGVSVQEANHYLASIPNFPLALKTSGASNGQTIAGAVSTGTHGSAFGLGAMQDYVAGIHLITGPHSSVWLERSSYPVLNEQFAQQLGAQLIRNDTLFNSALVSFGSFGVIQAILIEATPLYLLNATRWPGAYDESLRKAMTTLDFSGLDMPQPGAVPHHFEVVINPHGLKDGEGAYVTVMYKQPYRSDYSPPKPENFGGRGPGDNLLSIIGSLTSSPMTPFVGPLVNKLVSKKYPLYREKLGTPGQMFSSTTVFGKGMSMELGIPVEYSSRVLELVLSSSHIKNYAGVLGIRFVKNSSATLAFTRFAPVTCTMEFQAAYAKTTQKLYNHIWRELTLRNIPHALHWGQMSNFEPALIRAMYGSSADEWIASREALLSPEVRAIFNSEFLKSTGLAT